MNAHSTIKAKMTWNSHRPSPIQYILPIQEDRSLLDEEEDQDDTISEVGFAHSPHVRDGGVDRQDEAPFSALMRQAIPLVHPNSTAVSRTLGKLVDRNISRKILQRSQSSTKQFPGKNDQRATKEAKENVEMMKKCQQMFIEFDPFNPGEVKLCKIRQIIEKFHLQVDEIKFRQWEHHLPPDTKQITVSMFMEACKSWFGDKMYSILVMQYHDSHEKHKVPPPVIQKSQSAPALHPYDLMSQRHDATLRFSYEDYATNTAAAATAAAAAVERAKCTASTKQSHPAPYASKLLTNLEQHKKQGMGLIDAAHDFRRHTKMGFSLLRQDPGSCDIAHHDLMHQEKLARHLLKGCAKQALAPSNRQETNVETRRKRQQREQDKKIRIQNTEAANAFSASIAMIARHVQNEEVKDQRESALGEQISMVNQRKNQNLYSREHYAAIQEEKHTQQMRKVEVMKELNAHEVALVRNFLDMRKELIRNSKQPFQLSHSSSTLIQKPPELLAAITTTGATSESETSVSKKQKQQLKQIEKEFLAHTRSVQLLDYAHQKDQAKKHRVFPPAPAILTQLSSPELLPEELTKKFEEQEMLNHLMSKLMEEGVIEDMSTLIPPANSPPNAMRFYGRNRPGLLPPFASSADRISAPIPNLSDGTSQVQFS